MATKRKTKRTNKRRYTKSPETIARDARVKAMRILAEALRVLARG